MTKAEVASLLMLVKEYYPRDTEVNIKTRTAAWHFVLADYPYEVGKAAVVSFVTNDTKGFSPSVGQIVEQIRQFSRFADTESDELAAWEAVAKAARHASMSPSSRRLPDHRTSAEREFDALPELSKEVVHSPEQLAAWGTIDPETLNTVTQSNFLRAYRARRDQRSKIEALPSQVVLALSSVNACPQKMLKGDSG